ncbi:MAG: ankyrin repeat domain-containing protein [Planctomycetales bacterium]|nr:ankyrin repeat domain-containing protein [Planctomycetales bacterium]
MSTHKLPPGPDLEHLKRQAKSLLKDAKTGEPAACGRMAAQHFTALSSYTLASAQHTVAREYGFESWPKLKMHVEQVGKSLREKADQFLESAWHWGDRARAEFLVKEFPLVSQDSIHAAAAYGDDVRVADLLEQDPRIAVAKGGVKDWPPLLYAAWSCFWPSRSAGLLKVLRLLLDHGADPNSSWHNARYNQAESALYGTVEANSAAGARLLLEAGADPNDNESLYHACEKWNLDLLIALGDHGLHAKDISYCVKHALDMRWPEAVFWFLEMGAEPNALHPSAQETSLHWAVKRGARLGVIQALLDAGADPNARTQSGHAAFIGRKGNTPLDYALALGSTETAKLLRAHGGIASKRSTKEDWMVAAAAGDHQLAQALLDEHPNLHRELDVFERNLVAHVAQMENWSGVRLMIEQGWPIDAVGWMEARPLTWALCFGNAEMVDFLLNRGASLAPAGGYFQSPLHTVVHCRWEKRDQAACLERLLAEQVPLPHGFYPCGIAEFDKILSGVQ